MMKKTMIIVAGGSGSRMGAEIPKQFIELNGKPILMHTLENLHAMDQTMQLVLVLPKEQFFFWNELKEKHQFSVNHELAEGVRPFPSQKVIDACFAVANYSGAAIPVIPIVQSLRKLNNEQSEAVDRTNYRAVQTPQCFQTDILKKAFDAAEHTDYSDDATVVEAFGRTVHLIEGNIENIKITSPIDLELAQLIILRQSKPN